MTSKPKKRAAQVWALIIAEKVYDMLRKDHVLPFELPVDPMPRGHAVRTVQEVGMAKGQIDALSPSSPAIAWSLRFGPVLKGAGPDGQDLYPLIVDVPSAIRRQHRQNSTFMNMAMDLQASDAQANDMTSPPSPPSPLPPLKSETEDIISSWFNKE